MQRWISKLPDDLSVAELSIPGSHNSAAFKAEKSLSKYLTVGLWRCQQWSLQQQLNKGIRQVANQSTGLTKLHLHHMRYYLGQLQQAVIVFRQFLAKNPQEFLILQIQQEYSKHDHLLFGLEVKRLFLQFLIPFLDYSKCKKVIPTVLQLRGKAWLIQAAKVQMNQFHINTCIPALIQSHHYLLQNIWQKASQNTKLEAIYKIMAFENTKDVLKINFLSFSRWRDFFLGKKGFNNQIQKVLKQENHKNIGITLMDYPSESLIRLIVKQNNALLKN